LNGLAVRFLAITRGPHPTAARAKRLAGDRQQHLRVHVANLRRKIERDPVRPEIILTEPGVGYRLELPA
jgi:DNA-binding response OmpR family regulator